MDDIQRTLIKAGRKDLAQKYYSKVTAKPLEGPSLSDIQKKLKTEKPVRVSIIDRSKKLVKLIFKDKSTLTFRYQGFSK